MMSRKVQNKFGRRLNIQLVGVISTLYNERLYERLDEPLRKRLLDVQLDVRLYERLHERLFWPLRKEWEKL